MPITKKIKVIVFDLDGTLTKSRNKVTVSTAKLFCRLLNIKKVVVIGGGNYQQFQNQFLKYLPCSEFFNNLLILPTSGASMYFYHKNKWHKVYQKFLTKNEKQQIYQTFNKVFQKLNYKEPLKTYGKIFDDRQSQITFSALGQLAPLTKKQLWNKKNNKLRKQIAKELKKYLPDYVISLGGLTSIDITKGGIDKAYGIYQIMKFWNIRKEDLVFIGDALFKGGNDYLVKKTGIKTIQVKNYHQSEKLIKDILNKTSR